MATARRDLLTAPIIKRAFTYQLYKLSGGYCNSAEEIASETLAEYMPESECVVLCYDERIVHIGSLHESLDYVTERYISPFASLFISKFVPPEVLYYWAQ